MINIGLMRPSFRQWHWVSQVSDQSNKKVADFYLFMNFIFAVIDLLKVLYNIFRLSVLLFTQVPDIVKAQYRNPPACVIPDIKQSGVIIEPHMKPLQFPTNQEKEEVVPLLLSYL